MSNFYSLNLDLEELAKLLELTIELGLIDTVTHVDLAMQICNNGKKVIIGNKVKVTSRPNSARVNALKTIHEIKDQYLGGSPRSLTEIATP